MFCSVYYPFVKACVSTYVYVEHMVETSKCVNNSNNDSTDRGMHTPLRTSYHSIPFVCCRVLALLFSFVVFLFFRQMYICHNIIIHLCLLMAKSMFLLILPINFELELCYALNQCDQIS